MGEGIITRRGGAGGLEINGQDTFSGVYQESINKFDPVYVDVLRDFDTVTKLTDPATPPTNVGSGVAFSENNDYMSVAHSGSPFITIYKRSADTFTKLTDPATLPTSTGNGVAFSENNDYMSVAHAASPFITIYKRSADTFTKLTNPATLPTSVGQGVAFSENNDYMSVAHTSSPFVTIYRIYDEGIYPSNNILPPIFDSAGYALQNGNATDTIDMMKLFDKE